MKKIFSHVSKTTALVSAILGLFLAIIASWSAIKDWKRKDISGQWKIQFNTINSSYKAYIGDNHTQKIFFLQNDNEITGKGEKWEYNGKLIPFEDHRKLEYQGVLEDDCLKCDYTLHGLKRETTGQIIVTISSDGKKMLGKFSGTAANTSGTVIGEKLD